MPRSGFGEYERAVGEVEGGEVLSAADLGATRTPVEAPSDHQVQDEPEVALKSDSDALADPHELADSAPFDRGNGRIGGAEQERSGDTNLLDWVADDARLEGAQVRGDVGEFGHGEYRVSSNEKRQMIPGFK